MSIDSRKLSCIIFICENFCNISNKIIEDDRGKK